MTVSQHGTSSITVYILASPCTILTVTAGAALLGSRSLLTGAAHFHRVADNSGCGTSAALDRASFSLLDKFLHLLVNQHNSKSLLALAFGSLHASTLTVTLVGSYTLSIAAPSFANRDIAGPFVGLSGPA